MPRRATAEACLTPPSKRGDDWDAADLIWSKVPGLRGRFAETPAHLISMAFDEDLDEAARGALRAMIVMISERTGLSAEESYRLCSLAVDLRITQLVNVKKGVHAMLPRRYLGQKTIKGEGGPQPSE